MYEISISSKYKSSWDSVEYHLFHPHTIVWRTNNMLIDHRTCQSIVFTSWNRKFDNAVLFRFFYDVGSTLIILQNAGGRRLFLTNFDFCSFRIDLIFPHKCQVASVWSLVFKLWHYKVCNNPLTFNAVPSSDIPFCFKNWKLK